MAQSKLIDRLAGMSPRILVVGDIMLDHNRIAAATRISPEAPVPVLLNPRSEFRLGGAGAVAAMCAALGAEVCLSGIVGDDPPGRRVLALLDGCGVRFTGSVSSMRITTTKERIIGVASGRHQQQLGRVDCEQTEPLEPAQVQQLVRSFPLQNDIILVADYDKGVCVPDILQDLVRRDARVLVDPPRQADWLKYRGCAAIVPNRDEATGMSPAAMISDLKLRAVIVKQDQDGAVLYERGQPPWSIAAHVRRVHDVTGAGDQFLAVLGLWLAHDAGWREAVTWANCAAGLQVERQGCVPVTFQELCDAMDTAKRVDSVGPRLAAAG